MYKVTITKTATETQKSGKKWEIIGKRLVTDKDMEPSAYRDADLRQRVLNANVIMMDEMGYTPEIEKEVVVDRMIFEQTVDDLDVTAVIKAINKIEPVVNFRQPE